METKYKPFILLVMFSIAVITLEMVVYGDEITEAMSESDFGDIPEMPTSFYHICIPFTSLCVDIPDVLAWLGFFMALTAYLFGILSIALTLPIDSIPIVIRIVILAPIWIMVIVLTFNALKSLIKAIGDIIPL
jgi:hypothetical protein